MELCLAFTRALSCIATITLRSWRLRDVEGAKDQDEEESDAHTLLQKTGTRVTTPKTLGLINMTCWAVTTRPMEKASIWLWVTSWGQKAEKVVCETKSWPSSSAWLHSSFREKKGTSLPYLECLNLDCSAVSISDWLLGMENHQSNPKWSGVRRHLFFLLNHPDEESGAHRPELLCPAERPLEGTDGAE